MYKDILLLIRGEVCEKTRIGITVEGIFLSVLKGCFIKAYEFALFSCTSDFGKQAFFFAPALRGICEDYIVLDYLRSRKQSEDRDQIVRNKIMRQIADGSNAQKAFFTKHRPFQPVFQLDASYEVSKTNLPSVRQMAIDVSLQDIYEFMYAVTSDTVHFNPGIIMRNAWGSDGTSFENTIEYSAHYYQEFCRVYSIYFLCLYGTNFKDEFGFSPELLSQVARLNKLLDDELRWPEAITFEEMNARRPSDIIRVLLRSKHNLESVAQNHIND